jgi:hypothetical protein
MYVEVEIRTLDIYLFILRVKFLVTKLLDKRNFTLNMNKQSVQKIRMSTQAY